jgi:membrane protease YdiL (CAAX protease family)
MRIHVLVVTSGVFALWHLSYATLAAGYQLPPAQVVVFIANAAVIGAIWGAMRLLSGSIVVTAVSHSVWNAIAYMLFGEGPKVGALGVTQTLVYGPEVGFVGLILNCAFLLLLLRSCRENRRSTRWFG